MSEGGVAEGVVSRAELAELAEQFDAFEHAFDPGTVVVREAESGFDSRVLALYEERVVPRFPGLSYATFHCSLKSLCRVYLKKNLP
jgi:hypothetical protein